MAQHSGNPIFDAGAAAGGVGVPRLDECTANLISGIAKCSQ